MEKVLDKFIKVLKAKNKGKIRKVILFGSRAKGIAMPNSDYDLLVVLSEKDADFINWLYDEALVFLLKYKVDISLKIYLEEDFKRKLAMLTPFMKQIKQTGVELWVSGTKR